MAGLADRAGVWLFFIKPGEHEGNVAAECGDGFRGGEVRAEAGLGDRERFSLWPDALHLQVRGVVSREFPQIEKKPPQKARRAGGGDTGENEGEVTRGPAAARRQITSPN